MILHMGFCLLSFIFFWGETCGHRQRKSWRTKLPFGRIWRRHFLRLVWKIAIVILGCPGPIQGIDGFFLGVIPESSLGAPSVSKELFLSMDHPRVARLMDVYESEGRLSLVMECMEGCEGRAGGWWCRRWPKHQCHRLC